MLLAGSSEARAVAAALQETGVEFTAIITEAPKGPRSLGFEVELCEFLDLESLLAKLKATQVGAVLDASHGFDGQITKLGYAAARTLGLKHLRLERPLWETSYHPNWRKAPDLPAAMALHKPKARVFSATGWEGIAGYENFKGEVVYLRQTHQADRDVPFDFIQPTYGKPPFSVATEMALFQELKIDTLICRNLGGQASRPKLDAAEKLGLNVILIDPPEAPIGMKRVTDIGDAVAWALGL